MGINCHYAFVEKVNSSIAGAESNQFFIEHFNESYYANNGCCNH
jgi:hypothetical protein